MTPSEVAPNMVFGAWTTIGPACPEYRNGRRYVECLCWPCGLLHDVAAASLVNGTSRRCKSCSVQRKWCRTTANSPELLRKRQAQAERLALIRQVAERRQVQS